MHRPLGVNAKARSGPGDLIDSEWTRISASHASATQWIEFRTLAGSLPRPFASWGNRERHVSSADRSLPTNTDGAARLAEYDYDLIVIGSGPAGEKGAAAAGYFGKSVCLIERQACLGGAGVNTGTLPSKTLRETALYLSGFAQRGLYGIDYCMRREGISVRQFMVRKEWVVRTEIEQISKNLARHRVALVHGYARLVDGHTVEVALTAGGTKRIRAEVLLIATGSSPRRPEGIPFDDPDIEDSDSILELDRIPDTMTVIGGGVIGCEYASIFACLGVKVTLLEGKKTLLGFLDQEITDLLTKRLIALGIEIVLEDDVQRIVHGTGTGVVVETKSGRRVGAGKVLVAAGRQGNVDGLGLDDVGVKMNEHKRIVVDGTFRTSVSSIYAAGDVLGFPALASTSMEQGRIAMLNAFDLPYKLEVANELPYGLYTIPEVGSIGLSEEECQKRGPDYEVGRASYRENARGHIVSDLEGLLKLVFHPGDKRLLGVHIIGEKATEVLHIGQAVMRFGGTIDYFARCVFNYPTLSDMYKYAAYDGLGQLAKRAMRTASSSAR
jgi:NAD(P) transhydrogenase